MKNKQDYCEIDRVESNPTPKSSNWTKLTTIVLELASFVGAVDAIIEFINYILLLLK